MRPGRFVFLSLLFVAGLGASADNPGHAAERPPALCRDDSTSDSYPPVRLEAIARGLSKPVGLVHAGDGSGRLFIVEQRGTIRIWEEGALRKQPFLDLSSKVLNRGEMGLLGLVFHPKFAENGRLFVNYNSTEGELRTIIAEFRTERGAAQADPATERAVLEILQPYSNHNGGHLAFGMDGMLYIGTGDGGSGNDPHDNGQSTGTLLGKMLRIDVDRRDRGKAYASPPDNPFVGRAGVRPEIWAYGLRNPWRYSFDPATGLLYVGDVGQYDREEIDVVRRGGNYGWRIMEGSICTPGVNPACDRSGLELPIHDYPRSEGTVVIGGYVYRGKGVPGLCGLYLYGDYGNGRISGLRYDGSSATGTRTLLETGRSVSALGEDEERELYVVDHQGEVLKILPASP
jgi:glucose/arabinose dehydrogenase